ncbi:MAG TPA: aminopeptidase, partial [Rhodanobacteraceae bacterium]
MSLTALLVVALKVAPAAAAQPDPHSYGNPDEIAVRALALDLLVDFDQRRVDGTAEITLDWKNPAARQLALDTRDL